MQCVARVSIQSHAVNSQFDVGHKHVSHCAQLCTEMVKLKAQFPKCVPNVWSLPAYSRVNASTVTFRLELSSSQMEHNSCASKYRRICIVSRSRNLREAVQSRQWHLCSEINYSEATK